jgi:hypothetical protein
MLRIASRVLVAALAIAAAAPAQANWFKTFYHDVSGSWHRNNMWPEPFIEPDRAAVRTHFVVMQQRGWERQNLLGGHHFEEDQKRLTPAGHLRVKAILATSPAQYRAIYIEKGDHPDVTAMRLDAVQQAVVNLTPQGSLPPVQASDLVYEGWSGEYADAVGRKFTASMPAPRLPSTGGSGGSGSSGSSGP